MCAAIWFKFAIVTISTLNVSNAWTQNGFASLRGYTLSRLLQSMQNLACHRSMSGKSCLRLVEILGLPVTMSGNFCQILLYVQWCDGSYYRNHSQIVLCFENSIRILLLSARLFGNKVAPTLIPVNLNNLTYCPRA